MKHSTAAVYDTAIIGAGAAGLFAGACMTSASRMPLSSSELPFPKIIVLEKGKQPGRKLLMAGSGQCNLTHSGSIKEFISHYGSAGKSIRKILYSFGNTQVVSFFEGCGNELFTREDGKVFPKSLQGSDILHTLVQCCVNNGVEFRYSTPVTAIEKQEECFLLRCRKTDAGTREEIRARRVIVATGGCSYPTTGSDGTFFSVLEKLPIEIITPRPALVPVYTADYPYGKLSGVSFAPAALTLFDGKRGGKLAYIRDDLLLTHRGFSGPAVLNISRYAFSGQKMAINYLPETTEEETERGLKAVSQGCARHASSLLCEKYPKLPRRFLESICLRAGINPDQKSSQLSGAQLKALSSLLTEDSHTITGLGSFSAAMVTAGGVSLSEINLKTMEAVKYPGLYIVGEALDVDGDTGGYNLQFAFSTAHLAVASLCSR